MLLSEGTGSHLFSPTPIHPNTSFWPLPLDWPIQFSVSKITFKTLLWPRAYVTRFFLLLFKKNSRKNRLLPHLHTFPPNLSQTHSRWAFGLIIPQKPLSSRSTVTSTLQNSEVSAHFYSFLTCRHWTQLIPALSLLHFVHLVSMALSFWILLFHCQGHLLLSLVIPHHFLISKH